MLLAAAAGVTRYVDPPGNYYEGGPLRAARAATSRTCLVSDALVGTGSWRAFKLDIVRLIRPQAVVLGTSRVLQLAPEQGETTFANAGMPFLGTESLVPMLRRIHALAPGLRTVYIGVELFWFNRTWTDGVVFDLPPLTQLGSLLAHQHVTDSVRAFVKAPAGSGRGASSRETVAGRCVVDHGVKLARRQANGWEVDGSLRYVRDLLPQAGDHPDDDYTRDLVQFEGVYYRDWPRLEPDRLQQLADAVRLARSWGVQVVAYTPPYSSRYAERLATAPQTAARWREFAQVVPALVRETGGVWADTITAAKAGCTDAQFEDDGWHPDRACAAKVRAALDAAAGRQPG